MKGTIQLLNSAEEIVKQAKFDCDSQQQNFINSCKKIYPQKILLKCKFVSIYEEQVDKPSLRKEVQPYIKKQKSNFKKKKYGVKGGSFGKKIPQIRVSKYF